MTSMRIRAGALLSCLVLALASGACSKSGGGDAPSAADPVAAKAAEEAAAKAAEEAAAREAEEAKKRPRVYAGSYSLAPATMYISDAPAYARVKQAPDEPEKHVGAGELTVTVEPDGKVTGTIGAGPAAPAAIDGVLLGEEIRGNVRREDPDDEGLTGTFVGKLDGDKVEGTLSLADVNAKIVRAGKATLEKK